MKVKELKHYIWGESDKVCIYDVDNEEETLFHGKFETVPDELLEMEVHILFASRKNTITIGASNKVKYIFGEVSKLEQVEQELAKKERLYKELTSNYKYEHEENESFREKIRQIEGKYSDLQMKNAQLTMAYNELSIKYNSIIDTKREKGRPRKEVEINWKEIQKRMEHEFAEKIAVELGISRATLFRRLKESKTNNN